MKPNYLESLHEYRLSKINNTFGDVISQWGSAKAGFDENDSSYNNSFYNVQNFETSVSSNLQINENFGNMARSSAINSSYNKFCQRGGLCKNHPAERRAQGRRA